MSQAAHTIYKELVPLKNKYRYIKRNGAGGLRKDEYQELLFKYKYDFLKKKLEYLTQEKYDSYYERISYMEDQWGLSDDATILLNNKMKNDPDLIQLNRAVRILKIFLLRNGYNKIYL